MTQETDEDFLMRMAPCLAGGYWVAPPDRERFLALAKRGAAIPDGPTEAMCKAGYERIGFSVDVSPIHLGLAYRAMLQAALKPKDTP